MKFDDEVKVVAKPNAITERMHISLCNFSLKQQKLFEYIFFQSKKDVYRVTWAEVNNLFNIDMKNMTQTQKRQLVGDLVTLTLMLENENGGIRAYPVFSCIDLDNGIIDFELNNRAVDALNTIGGNYFNVNLNQLAMFRHQYTNLIFQKLKSDFNSYERGEWTLKYNLDHLRKWLGVEKKYKKIEHFREKVIKPSIIEIDSYTDLEIVRFYKVRGKDEVCFIVKNRSTTQDYLDKKNENYKSLKEKNSAKKEKKYRDRVAKEEIDVGYFGEFGHVKLTREQYNKSRNLFASEEEFYKGIELVDGYFEQLPGTADKFKNHYISLKNFAKPIIDAKKNKLNQKNYNSIYNQKGSYVEPTYEKYDNSNNINEIDIDNLFDSKVSITKETVGNNNELVQSELSIDEYVYFCKFEEVIEHEVCYEHGGFYIKKSVSKVENGKLLVTKEFLGK